MKTVSNRKNKTNIARAKNEIIESRTQVATMSYQHSGPIPDPMTLERYEQILPGAAERILAMAEKQSDHRQSLESIVIKSGSRDSLLGVISAFVIGMTITICGTIVILNGHLWPGTIIGSVGTAGLVGVFIYGTRSARKEREEKNKQ